MKRNLPLLLLRHYKEHEEVYAKTAETVKQKEKEIKELKEQNSELKEKIRYLEFLNIYEQTMFCSK